MEFLVILDVFCDQVNTTEIQVFLRAAIAIYSTVKILSCGGSTPIWIKPSPERSLGYKPFALGLESSTGSCLPAALTSALCYLNKTDGKKRILILSNSNESPNHHVTLMNAFFGAQRSSVTIDCCRLNTPSRSLSQGAAITNGIYSVIKKDVLSTLLFTFLPHPEMRKTLVIPSQTSSDSAATCFCHKKRVQMGFVCSICLSVYCESLASCPTCLSVFSNV